MHRDQTRPFQRLQDAMGKDRHVPPTAVVPIRAFPIECTIKLALACTVFNFDINHVEPDIPIAEWALIEPSIRGMIYMQNVERDQFMEERT